MTLLEMTQNILSALDEDEVNSISDTVASVQVAEVIKETFYEQFSNIFIPEFRKLIQLESVSDLVRPNYLRIPSNVSKLEWVKYKDFRNESRFRELDYLAPEEFLERRLQYTADHNNVVLTEDFSGIEFYIHTDRGPSYFTMFDDTHIVTDGYDVENESVLQTSNTLAYAWVNEEFRMEDDYVPPLDGNLFPLFLAEAKSTAFINLKQISSSKEEQRARRQRVRMQNDQFRAKKARHGYRLGVDFSRTR
jgi:hypothetical protein